MQQEQPQYEYQQQARGGWEETDPANPNSGAVTWYVDPQGDDAWNGLAPTASGFDGPKATAYAAAESSLDGDTIQIAPGAYFESEIPPLSGLREIIPVYTVIITP